MGVLTVVCLDRWTVASTEQLSVGKMVEQMADTMDLKLAEKMVEQMADMMVE